MRWEDADVAATSSGAEALRLLDDAPPDLVVLDLGLPGDDGIDLLRRLRERSRVPVVILTGSDDQARRVVGLEYGADDYILKPFNYAEFLARVNAVLRRAAPVQAPVGPTDVAPGLRIDVPGHRAVLHGADVRFTPTEWAVLTTLHARTGEVVTMRELSERVWDTSAPQTTAIKTVVRQLRLKLEEDPADPKLITSARGFGYCFERFT